MRIAFFETSKQEQAYLSSLLGTAHEVRFFEDRLAPEHLPELTDVEALSVFINSPISAQTLDALPNLRLITTRSTGFDHIDFAYAKNKGVAVANVPAYGARTVAEFAFGLMLTLSRKIFHAYHQLREGNDFSSEQLEGFDLFGKTLGVIGTGRIGKNVIAIAQGFGMQVLAHDAHPDQAFSEQHGFSYTDLPSLLAQSDIVTLHAPHTKETHHLINQTNITLMKRGSLLINTARGELVETGALIEALRSGHIAGAGLDVLEEERSLKEELEMFGQHREIKANMRTVIQDHILIDLPQVVVTPHIAFFTREAKQEILRVTVENILNFAAGKPQNIVS